jgi:4'-phosphopantetheinyl transferase
MNPTRPPTWLPAPAAPTLGPEEIHLWRYSLAATAEELANLRALLAADEIARADRLLRPSDGQRFTAGRGRLRQILSRYLSIPPGAIPLTTGAQAKPAVAGSPLSFNLAHSGESALLAVARSCELGVDLETIDPALDWIPLARRYFADSERQALLALPPSQQPSAFFATWTRKEAILKALGSGFQLPCDSFAVSVPPAPAALLRHRGDVEAPQRWRLQDLPLGPGYRAALAYPAPSKFLVLWDLESP